MAYDITTTILNVLSDLYVAEMRTNIVPTDPLRVRNVFLYPPQFDPTLVAPYILVAVDHHRGRIPDPVHDDDIGGGLRWMNFFQVLGRIPQHSSVGSAYTDIGILNQRALRVLLKHWSLDGRAVADNGEQVFASSRRMILRNNLRPFGGDNEWYGEFVIDLYFFSEELPEMDTP